MITKADLKYYSSLLHKKIRDEEKKFLVEGEKSVFEALNSSYDCEAIFCIKEDKEKFYKSFSRFLSKINRMDFISEKELKKLQDTVKSQGIVAAFKKKESRSTKKSNDHLIVGLEEINDPGNLGTIIRNADWFGISDIILSENCADVYNPKTIRASAGSIFHLNIIRGEKFFHYIHELKQKGYKILCADISGENVYELEKFDRVIVVLSNEANGPSEDLLNLSDVKITIPKKGKAESLNVASASAIILSELVKNKE